MSIAALPWLGPEYSNDNMNFETQFQDWEIESPTVVLQEALGELWKKVVHGIHAEFGGLHMPPFHHTALSASPGSTLASPSTSGSSENICRCNS